jgi:DNA modification methylase
MTTKGKSGSVQRASAGRPSALIDTRVIYCGDCLDQLRRLPEACTDLIYIDPPFNSNRTYEVFWGDLSEPRPLGSGFEPAFEDRYAGTQSYIEYMRPRWDSAAICGNLHEHTSTRRTWLCF